MLGAELFETVPVDGLKVNDAETFDPTLPPNTFDEADGGEVAELLPKLNAEGF